MRVAAIYDIHGNLPALEAVLDEVRQEDVDHVVVQGHQATLIDLSVIGAQVISPTILRPGQPVCVLLPREADVVQINGRIVWAAFELPRSAPAPQYRAGIEFSDEDPRALEARREAPQP